MTMRALGRLTFTGINELGPGFQWLHTCHCSPAGDGKLPTDHMPQMTPDQVLIRVFIGRSGVHNTFMVDTVEEIAAANAEYDSGPADRAQIWLIANRDAVAARFGVTV